MEHECPCKDCDTRDFYAHIGLTIWGEDCPYICEEWDKWKAEQKDGDGE